MSNAIRISRRRALRLLGLSGVVALGAACAPISTSSPTAAPPKPTEPPKPAAKPTGAPSAGAATPAAKPSATQAPAVAIGKRGGKLTVGRRIDLFNFDPTNFALGNVSMTNSLFDVLALYDENLKPQPRLAESWDLAPDGMSVKLNLRKGVTFHSGRDFNADDVLWNLMRSQDPAVGANTRVLAQTVARAEAPDPYTVIFHYASPNPAPFELLHLFYVLDRQSADDLKTKGVGTGPFKLAEWRPGDQARFVRNEQYWNRERPLLDEVVLRVLPDQQTMSANLETGTVDMLSYPAFTEVARLKDHPSLQGISAPPGGQVLNVLMNVTQPPFDNKLVRQAVDWAVDRQRIGQVAYSDTAAPMQIPFPKGIVGYDEALNSHATFDLERAKRLLTEAGHPNGFEATVQASSSIAIERAQAAQIIQADLAKIGVRLKIEDPEAAVYRQRFLKGEYQMAVHSSNQTNKDPSTIFGALQTYSPTNGSTQYKSEAYSRLIAEGATTLDEGRRREIYRQLGQLLVDEAFVLVVCERPLINLAARQLKGARISHDGFELFGDAWLDR
ncbi:MAG: hypothetical protein H0V51_18805 [Chloroflexi bacterium]|nr:hypothetical protein [Chloroflexota bacterium]